MNGGDDVFAAAVEDLEQATDLEPNLAGAWNVLSIARSQVPDVVGANIGGFSRVAEAMISQGPV